MPEFTLFTSPGACSRVTMNALEEIGAEYADRVVVLGRGEHKLPEYLAVNPKGKVPALLVGDRILTENPAILWYLASTFPEAGLLPGNDDPLAAAQALSDLVWCGGTLHPMLRQLARPTMFSDASPDAVKASGIAQLDGCAATIEDRLARGWWYGDTWSIVDVYIYWVTSTARTFGYNFNRPEIVEAHDARVRARPSFQRALKREEDAVRNFSIPLPPGAKL